jgi:putative acetyltransferase
VVNPVIRPETPSDVTAIHTLTVAAFLRAPHTDHTEQFILAALRSAGALTVSLVAELSGGIIGHVAASPVSVSDGSRGWYGLGPISVGPKFQRQGVGGLLMHAAIRALRNIGAEGCVLLGDPTYYARFGFKHESALVLPDVPAEYFQALLFGSVLPCGVVSYHEAFRAQG